MWGQINQNEQGNNCSSHNITINVEVMKETRKIILKNVNFLPREVVYMICKQVLKLFSIKTCPHLQCPVFLPPPDSTSQLCTILQLCVLQKKGLH